MVRLDQWRRLGQDRAEVPHQLQALEQIGTGQAYALASQFEEIDHLVPPVALVTAEVTVANVADAGDCCDAEATGTWSRKSPQ